MASDPYNTGATPYTKAAADDPNVTGRISREYGTYKDENGNPLRMDTVNAGTHGTYRSPGAAEYSTHQGADGRGGTAEDRYNLLRQNVGKNDKEQTKNLEAMARTRQNFLAERGPMAVENAGLTKRFADTRGQQLDALGLSRAAAMGQAPSEAAYATRAGMNDSMGGFQGSLGSARGLTALSGAQALGGSALGSQASAVGTQGGMARSKEIGDSIGMLGTQAADVHGADLARLGQNSQNAMFNAGLNDDYRLGNLNMLAAQGNLASGQSAQDLAWQNAAVHGFDVNLNNEQQMAGMQAGVEADSVAEALARDRESKENTRQLVNGGVAAGLTAIGSLGGPVGSALGMGAGVAVGKATQDLW